MIIQPVNCNEHIHAQTKQTVVSNIASSQLLLAAQDFDGLWEKFIVENESVLEALHDLNKANEFPTTLKICIHGFHHQTIVSQYSKQSLGFFESIGEEDRNSFTAT